MPSPGTLDDLNNIKQLGQLFLGITRETHIVLELTIYISLIHRMPTELYFIHCVKGISIVQKEPKYGIANQ